MNLVINKCVTDVILSNFSGHYLRNHSTLDIGVLGYIGVIEHKEHSPKVWHISPGTPCIKTNNPESSYALHILNQHQHGPIKDTVERITPEHKCAHTNCLDSYYTQILQ